MFIITKTFTDDDGHLFTKVNPKQYSTPEEAYDAMREDYLNELKTTVRRSLSQASATIIPTASGLFSMIMARFFVYSTKEAAAALKEAHIPYRVHGEYCISVNNDDYSTAVEAFFRNDVSFQPE